MQRLHPAVAHPIQVPPPGAVGYEVQVAGRAPRGLEDRLLTEPAGDPTCLLDRAVLGELADEDLASVPRHPGEIPFQPADLRSVGCDAGRGVEVPTRADHDGLRRAVGGE